jgi:hypothetical protein
MDQLELDFLSPRGGSVSKVISAFDLIGQHLRRYQPFANGEIKRVKNLEDNIKGKMVEIDSMYGTDMMIDGEVKRVLISIEIKRMDEVVIGDQVRAQLLKLAHHAKAKKASQAYKAVEYVIGMAVAPRKINGKNTMCVWSLKPIAVRDAAQILQDQPHQLDIEIASKEAFQFSKQLDIF